MSRLTRIAGKEFADFKEEAVISKFTRELNEEAPKVELNKKYIFGNVKTKKVICILEKTSRYIKFKTKLSTFVVVYNKEHTKYDGSNNKINNTN